MSCETVKRSIPLYLYGELPAETEENVEAHLDECAGCAKELAVQRELARGLNEHELEPTLDLLVECRQSLALELSSREEFAGKPGIASLWRRIFGFPIERFRVPAAAMALFAMGWFSARVPVTRLGAQPDFVSTIRSITPDPSGKIMISVDDTHRRVIAGLPDEGRIKELLLTGLREQANPGVRVVAVQFLKDMSSDGEVRLALLESLQRDPNPGVRLKALEGLQQFGYDKQVRQALTSVLMSDSNAGVRIGAIDLLTSRYDDSLAGVLQNLVRREDNDYVRLRGVRALQEMNASVGSF